MLQGRKAGSLHKAAAVSYTSLLLKEFHGSESMLLSVP